MKSSIITKLFLALILTVTFAMPATILAAPAPGNSLTSINSSFVTPQPVLGLLFQVDLANEPAVVKIKALFKQVYDLIFDNRMIIAGAVLGLAAVFWAVAGARAGKPAFVGAIVASIVLMSLKTIVGLLSSIFS